MVRKTVPTRPQQRGVQDDNCVRKPLISNVLKGIVIVEKEEGMVKGICIPENVGHVFSICCDVLPDVEGSHQTLPWVGKGAGVVWRGGRVLTRLVVRRVICCWSKG